MSKFFRYERPSVESVDFKIEAGFTQTYEEDGSLEM